MTTDKKFFNYYVELFYKGIDLPYILQTRCFETKKDAINLARKFIKNIDYIDFDLSFRIMAFYGDEENYDIVELGHFEGLKYIETYKEI